MHDAVCKRYGNLRDGPSDSLQHQPKCLLWLHRKDQRLHSHHNSFIPSALLDELHDESGWVKAHQPRARGVAIYRKDVAGTELPGFRGEA